MNKTGNIIWNNQRKRIKIFLLLGVILSFHHSMTFYAKETVTVDSFLEQMLKSLSIPYKQEDTITIAKKYGILTRNSELAKEDLVTKTIAARLLERADTYYNGNSYQEDLYNIIINQNRISDLKQIQKEDRDSVVKVYLKGILTGESAGTCSGRIRFEGERLITKEQMKESIERVVDKKKRKKLSPYGQLIRTTNLPKNKEDFPYILEGFPNEYYEKKFDYELYVDYQANKFVEMKDFIRPVNFRKASYLCYNELLDMEYVLKCYEDKWLSIVKSNLTSRFNVDYRTIETGEWEEKLKLSYINPTMPEFSDKKRRQIQDYKKKAKKNHVILRGIVQVDPSGIYKSYVGYYVRAYVKFKVSCDKIPEDKRELVLGDEVVLSNIEKEKWIKTYVDLPLSTNNGYSDGSDLCIMSDRIWDI